MERKTKLHWTTLEFPVNIRRGREKRLLTRIHPVWHRDEEFPVIIPWLTMSINTSPARIWNCNHKHRSISILVYVCMYLSMVFAVSSDEADLSMVPSLVVRLNLASPSACRFHMCVYSWKKNPSSCLVSASCVRAYLDEKSVRGWFSGSAARPGRRGEASARSWTY